MIDMQVRRQQSDDGSGFGKPLPKSLQNSPYAASVLAPGLHKKIARRRSSDKAASQSHSRQPRLSRGERSDIDLSGKLLVPSNPQHNDHPPSNQREGRKLQSPRSAGTMGAPDGVVAYRGSTNIRGKPNSSSNVKSLPISPRSNNNHHHHHNNNHSIDKDTPLALPNVLKTPMVGPSISLLKTSNPKIVGNSKSTTSIRPTNTSPKNLHHSTSQDSSFKMHNVGLTNLGNTCFMNSPLQCILHIKPLVLYFKSGKFEQDINPASPTKGKLACTFGELIRDIFSVSSGKSFTPSSFKKEITKMAPHLFDYEQQDCQEFLRFLLDGLSEDLGRIRAENVSIPAPISSPSKVESTDNTSANLLSLALGDDESCSSSNSPPPMISKNRPQPPSLNQPKSSLPDKFRSKIRSISASDAVHDTSVQDRIPDQRCYSGSVLQEESTSNNCVALEEENSKNNSKDTHDIETFKKLQEAALQREKSRNTIGDSLKQVVKESNESWNRYLKKNDSVISDIFAGQLQSTIECLTCHHRSHCFDPFIDLSVPIEIPTSESSNSSKGVLGGRRNFRDPSSCTLEDCFKSFSATEILEGDNAYNCEKCKSKQRSSKRLTIFNYPEILIIHIKRFRFTAIRREKINTDVKFPASGLNLMSYLSPDSIELSKIGGGGERSNVPPPIYDLAGVTNHSGGMNGGHYIAHVDSCADPAARVDTSRDKDWLCFNDCRVSQSSINAAGGPSAYMLFYRRRDTSKKSTSVTTVQI